MKQLLFQNADVFPAIGLGTYLSKKNDVYNAVVEAIRIGYRHIDCAYIYGNEAEIGSAIRFCIDGGMVTREDLFITSKLWNSDHAPERVQAAIHKSLNDLQLDYLDLYLMHWPIAFKTGHEQAKDATDLLSLEEMPISTTWKAMEATQQDGLTRHIGVSNFNIPKLQNLFQRAQQKPEVNQIELHPYFQQTELVEFCQANKVLVTAFSPLGSRHLINGEDSITNNHTVIEIAQKHACLPSQILLAWGIKRGTSVIPKSVNYVRIKENLEAGHVELDESDMIELGKIDRNIRLAKGLYCIFPNGYYNLENIWES
jgi:alcohol dehydrogenase (NADP+)